MKIKCVSWSWIDMLLPNGYFTCFRMVFCKQSSYVECQPRMNYWLAYPQIDWCNQYPLWSPMKIEWVSWSRVNMFQLFQLLVSKSPPATDPMMTRAVSQPFSTQNHRLDTPLSGPSRSHGGPHGMHRRQCRRHGHGGHSGTGMRHGEKGKAQEPVRTEKNVASKSHVSEHIMRI